MTQTLNFRYDLSPTPEQDAAISSHVGAVRWAYNWAVAYVSDNWEAAKKGIETEYVNNSFYGLRHALNAVKDETAPWWHENSKSAFESGTENAAKAFKNWQSSRKGTRKGKKVGFPQFKKKSLTNDGAVRFTGSPMRLEGDYITVARIGSIRLHERPKPVLWLLREGARITQIAISRNGTRWAASISVKMEDELAHRYFAGKTKKASKKAVGVDVGIKDAYITSDGLVVANPRHYMNLQRKLRKQQKRLSRRQAPDYKNGVAPSRRWENARDDVRKTHARVVNTRKDFIHKTTRSLIDTYETIVIEKLNVSGMVKNKHLSKHILDASFAEFRRQLEYKARWYNREIILADTFYPSSKTCSGCGEVKAKLSLSERTYNCEACGLVIDRDYNAARNLVALSYRETQNGRGGESSGLVLPPDETIARETTSELVSQAKQGS
jgi:IS605 OrfB family transposase